MRRLGSRKLMLLRIFYFLISNVCWAQDTLWTRIYNNSEAMAVATEKEGNVIVTGTVTIKYTSNGDILWIKDFGAKMTDIAIDHSNNIILCKETLNNTLAFIKCTPEGESILSVSYSEGTFLTGGAIATDFFNNIIVGGTVEDTSLCFAYLILKYDSLGNLLWRRTYSPGYEKTIRDIVTDSLNNIIVTGAICKSGSGWDWCTIKYSPDGDTLWVRELDSTDCDVALTVTTDKFGNVVVGGVIDTPTHFYGVYVSKYDYYGNLLWIKMYEEESEATYVSIDSDCNIIIGTRPWSSNTCIPDYRIIKCDSLGNIIWKRTYNRGDDYISGVAVDTFNDIIVTGNSDGDFLTIKYSGTHGAEEFPDKLSISLFTQFPIPFGHSGAEIKYTIIEKGDVSLKIYDLKGKLIRTLVDLIQEPGTYAVYWDGSGENEEELPNGIYFCKLRVGNKFYYTQKCILIK